MCAITVEKIDRQAKSLGQRFDWYKYLESLLFWGTWKLNAVWLVVSNCEDEVSRVILLLN
jgi:hypothetical protein